MSTITLPVVALTIYRHLLTVPLHLALVALKTTVKLVRILPRV
jgi:hypothetical protein